MNKVAFLGGGSFGTALAVLIANKGYEVNFWLRDEVQAKEINEHRRNIKYYCRHTMNYLKDIHWLSNKG